MSKIRIKNFGPIKEGYIAEDGWLDIKKVTLFIGDQGTGKSSVAKLFSTLSWLEKAMYRGDVTKVSGDSFVREFCAYQGVKNYFRPSTQIDYSGEAFSFSYTDGNLITRENKVDKHNLVPKIMYVPAERNFLSSVRDADNVKGLPTPLYTFLDEYDRSLKELNEILDLPIGKMKFEYQENTKTTYIHGENYRINLLEASSGLHSFVPLFIVSRNLALSISKKEDASKSEISLTHGRRIRRELEQIILNEKLSEELKNEAIRLLSSKYRNSCFINIVEEPEQNLFPKSQRQMLFSLLDFVNISEGNKLIMTSHSPYIINNLSIAIQADYLKHKIESASKPELFDRLVKIIPTQSTIPSDDVVIYELQDGKIIHLPDYEGIPSDKNYLNQSLVEGNQLFDSLLEIEQEL